MVGYFAVFVVCAVMGWFCCCDSGSITLGGIALGLDLFSIPDSVIRADVWASHSVINGLIDAVLRREKIKSCNAFMAALVEEIFGMVNLLGNKFTASGILYYPVLGMNIFGNYNFPWLFRCTRQVHHVMPRRLCNLACYLPPPLLLVGKLVLCCIQTCHLGACRPTVLGVKLIVEGG